MKKSKAGFVFLYCVLTFLSCASAFANPPTTPDLKHTAIALETMLTDASKGGWTQARIGVVLNSIEKLKSDKQLLREIFGKFEPEQLLSMPPNVAAKYVLSIIENSAISKPSSVDLVMLSKYDSRISDGLVHMAHNAKQKAAATIDNVVFSTAKDGKLISSIVTDKGTTIQMQFQDGKLELLKDLTKFVITGTDPKNPTFIPVDTPNRKFTVNANGEIEQSAAESAPQKAEPQQRPAAQKKVTVKTQPKPEQRPQRTSRPSSRSEQPVTLGEARSVPRKSNSIFWPDLPWAQVAFGITPEYTQTAAHTEGSLNLDFESDGKLARASIPEGGSFSLSGWFKSLFGPLFGSFSAPFQWTQASGQGMFEQKTQKSYRVVWNSREVGQVVFCEEPCKDYRFS